MRALPVRGGRAAPRNLACPKTGTTLRVARWFHKAPVEIKSVARGEAALVAFALPSAAEVVRLGAPLPSNPAYGMAGVGGFERSTATTSPVEWSTISIVA
jgi:hypothetical protein